MWTLTILAVLAQAPATFADSYAVAVADLMARPADLRRTTRYLSLANIRPSNRAALTKALTFALNSTSFRSEMVRPESLADGTLLRIDLRSLGWDRDTRAARLNRMRLSGVQFSPTLDVWEQFAKADPYYKVTTPHGGRGWIDPALEYQARQASYSITFILRGDWLLSKLMTDRPSGFYSDVLMLPPKENDLYRVFGIDVAFVDRENQLKRGGAVLESIVALHNRELQQIPSLYGYDDRFIWRTFDVNVDKAGDKSVLEAFAGRLKLDGREIIGTLPNGLHWYYLANAVGNQVAEVPTDIAQDMRQTREPVRDRRVLSPYKCVACHGPQNGTYPFDDVVSKAMLNPAVGILAVFKDKVKLADEKERIEEYYLSGLGRQIRRQQDSYAERLKVCNGETGTENAVNVVSLVEAYPANLVTREQAARDMGLTVPEAVKAWRLSGNSQLVVLSSGQPIRRAAWESAFQDAMRAVAWPWEKAS